LEQLYFSDPGAAALPCLLLQTQIKNFWINERVVSHRAGGKN